MTGDAAPERAYVGVLGRVLTALVFCAVVTPAGVTRRLLGRGIVRRLRPDPQAASYWIDRAGRPWSGMHRRY